MTIKADILKGTNPKGQDFPRGLEHAIKVWEGATYVQASEALQYAPRATRNAPKGIATRWLAVFQSRYLRALYRLQGAV